MNAVTLDLIAPHRSTIHALARLHRAANPRIFGSVVRGEATENSDIDVLVDALPGATLLDLGALQVALETLLQRHVDLLTPGDLPEHFRAEVLAHALSVSII